MDRTLALLALIVAAPFVGLLVYNGFQDPVADQRTWMEDQLSGIVTGGGDRSEEPALPAWHESMQSRPNAWQTITTPPPAPPPPKPKAPEPPDVKKMLEGLRPTKAQIGDKIKIITPQNERGEWFVIGDVFNGCVLTAIEKTEVVFTYEWREGGNKKFDVRLTRGAKEAPRRPEAEDAPPPPAEEKKPAPKGAPKKAPKKEEAKADPKAKQPPAEKEAPQEDNAQEAPPESAPDAAPDSPPAEAPKKPAQNPRRAPAKPRGERSDAPPAEAPAAEPAQ